MAAPKKRLCLDAWCQLSAIAMSESLSFKTVYQTIWVILFLIVPVSGGGKMFSTIVI